MLYGPVVEYHSYWEDLTMRKAVKSAAIYTRVSTDSQTIENQLRELRQVAERRGWEVVDTTMPVSVARKVAPIGPALISCLRKRAAGSSMWPWPGQSTGSDDR